MVRTRRFVAGPGNLLRRYRLCGAVLTSCLLGGLWGMGESTASGADPRQRTTTCRLAMPMRSIELIRLLDDPRPAIRLEAINCLATLNRPATETVPALLRRFNDPDLDVRVQAVRVAVRAGLPAQQCVNVAAQLLIPERPEVCLPAIQILSEAGPAARDALPQLHHCLTASSLWVRLHAARAVIRMDATDKQALSTIQAAQEDEHQDAREFAATVMSDSVRTLAAPLKHGDPEARRSAAVQIERLGSAAASASGALTGSLFDPDLLVRAHAARAAYVAGAPRHQIVKIASELLVPERADVTRIAASILADIGPEAAEAIPRLYGCLNSSSIAVRLHAAEAVVHIDANDLLALDELEKAFDQQEVEVRYFAVNVLGFAACDSDQAIFVMQRALCDSHPKVSTAAALQLSRMHELTRHALPDALRPTAVDVAKWISELSNAAVDVRRTAALRLLHAGPAARNMGPELIDHLGDGDPLVQLYVAQAIWEIDRSGYAILPVLFDLLLTNRGNARMGAIHTLGQMGPAAVDTIPWLTQLLNSSRSFDKLLLANAIARIEPTRRSATEILIGGLYSRNTDVRYLSTLALGTAPLTQQAAAEEALREVVADRNSRVRSAANEALGRWQTRQEMARAARRSPPGTVIPAAATGGPRH